VKQSQGHIRIYSEPGQGTTVKLYLPRAAVVEQTGALLPEPQAAAADHRGSERILLVEDDDLVRDHATQLLESNGYAVTTSPDAPFALDLIRSGAQFDLIFTDLVMPGGMNGYELATAVREICPDIAVLCTSGYADLAVIRTSQLAPDVVFLSKPYRRNELTAKVQEALALPITAKDTSRQSR
jgi:CheY-like chemotaxis protein